MVEEFFVDDHDRIAARMAGEKVGVPRVVRKQKMAAIERRLSPFATCGEDPRAPAEAITLALDGYEHGAYTQIMEMYDPTVDAFRMRGGLDHWVRDWVRYCALLASPALNGVSVMLRQLGGTHATGKADRLTEVRKRLEASPEYG